MENLSFKNFKYLLINSPKNGYKEILVTFDADDKVGRQCIFVKEVEGQNSTYYINKAKEIINEKINNGQLAKAVKKQTRHSSGVLKPILISLGVILGIAGAGVGGYYTYRVINGEGGGQGGGGGGGSYEPGDIAPVEIESKDFPTGVTISADANAVIGNDYNATLTLKENVKSNGKHYALPTALKKVTCKNGSEVTQIENYKYKKVNNSEASLFISKEYVLGLIGIELDLNETIDYNATTFATTSHCKIWNSDRSLQIGQDETVVTLTDSPDGLTYKYSFKVDIDNDYILTSDGIIVTYINKEGDEVDATWTLDGGSLNVSILKANLGDTTQIKIDAYAYQDPDTLNVFITSEHCYVFNDQDEEVSGLTQVYPDEDGKFTFTIEVNQDCTLVRNDLQINPVGRALIDSFIQTGEFTYQVTFQVDYPYSYRSFNLNVVAPQLPSDPYAKLDFNSIKYGKFDYEGHIYHTVSGGGDTKVEFWPEADYVNTEFMPIVNGSTPVTNVSYTKPSGPGAPGYIQMNISSPTEGCVYTISLFESTDNPTLTLDDDTSEFIVFTNESGEVLPEQEESLAGIPGKKSEFSFYFNFTDNVPEKGEDNIVKWADSLSINEYDYSITTDIGDGVKSVYTATITLTGWESLTKGFNLTLHATEPDRVTATMSEDFDPNLVTISYDGTILGPKQEIFVYPEENVVAFDYSDLGDDYVIYDNCISVTGGGKGIKGHVDVDNDKIIFESVTENFTFNVTPVKSTVDISVSTDIDAAKYKLSYTTPQGKTIVISPSGPVTIGFSTSMSSIAINVESLTHDSYAIETICPISYEKVDGSKGTIYGRYSYENNNIEFNLDGKSGISDFVSFKISAFVHTVDYSAVKCGIAQSGSIGMFFVDGHSFQVKTGETSVVNYITRSETKMYIEAKNLQKVTVTGDENVTATVSPTTEEGVYPYVVTISGVSGASNFTLTFENA